MTPVRFSTVILAIAALPLGYLAAAWMNDSLFELADSSEGWEHFADVVWSPGIIATHLTHVNVERQVVHCFYTVLFAGLIFLLMRWLRDRILADRKAKSGEN